MGRINPFYVTKHCESKRGMQNAAQRIPECTFCHFAKTDAVTGAYGNE
jgi:hypothetical protein